MKGSLRPYQFGSRSLLALVLIAVLLVWLMASLYQFASTDIVSSGSSRRWRHTHENIRIPKEQQELFWTDWIKFRNQQTVFIVDYIDGVGKLETKWHDDPVTELKRVNGLGKRSSTLVILLENGRYVSQTQALDDKTSDMVQSRMHSGFEETEEVVKKLFGYTASRKK